MNLRITYPHVVWYSQLEKLMKELYGRHIDIADDFECGQNSFIEIEVHKSGPDSVPWPQMDSYEDWSIEKGLELVDKWIAGEEELPLEMIMWRMAYDDIIPEGDYLITVWW